MQTVLITGGTGMIGTRLSKTLKEKGYRVTFLSRKRKKEDPLVYQWDWTRDHIEKGALENADYIIHLAGANLLDTPWTQKGMQAIVDSRVRSGQMIFKNIKALNKKPVAFISASAVGHYGVEASQRIFIETDPPAGDFLAETCRKWEQMADQFGTLGIRTVKIRTAPVMAMEGGALPKMITPLKWGIAPVIGKGQQYMPWIHIDDLCGIYLKAIEDVQMSGAYNAVAPEHRTNKDFVHTLARHLGKIIWLPRIPLFLVKLVFGKKSMALTGGSRVSSDKIRDAGYTFKFPGLQEALAEILKK